MASDSSASTTPMVITPESTGGLPEPKQTRQQAAFYPNINPTNKPVKPFSRSAAKRESVMALGSIEHLQHYFTKAGIASKKNPLEKAQYGLVPAIGGKAHVPSAPSTGTLAEFKLPPSPAIPSPPLRQPHAPHVKSYDLDPVNLLPGVCEDLSSVARAWQISQSANASPSILQPVDVLDVLKSTTRVIRSVRNYLLSLPDESTGTIRANFRAAVLGPGTPSNTSTSSKGRSDPLSRIRRSALEVLAMLRVLEEKYRLPLSDDAYDAQSDGGSRGNSRSQFHSPNSLSQELPDEEPRRSMPDTIKVDPDVAFTYSLIQVNGQYQQVPVWEDEDEGFQVQDEEEQEKRARWDERLVLAGGWLYKQDIQLVELEKEREVVFDYLDIVDKVLFEAKPGAERGWEQERKRYQGRSTPQSRSEGRRISTGSNDDKGLGHIFLGVHGGSRRRVSTGMVDMIQSSLKEEPEEMVTIAQDVRHDEPVEDHLLPEWARRSNFINDELGRAYSVLSHFLPNDLLMMLRHPTSPSAFLDSLSSGQLLCIAYNAIVRRSKKPWGYINKEGIHDILALEAANQSEQSKEGTKKGWTFRRTDNLRLWIGAIKLRYLLPVQQPSQKIKPNLDFGLASSLSTPIVSFSSYSSLSSPQLPILFDARTVAHQEGDWEIMLQAALVAWISQVVGERQLYQ